MAIVQFDELRSVLAEVLRGRGFASEAAAVIAGVFAENNLEGVDSHGLERFPSLLRSVDEGLIQVTDGPIRGASFGAWEQWDGRRGAGPLNARLAMGRAMELAKESGLGSVALRGTNHWTRGGAYGKQAAEAGMVGICWTNTMPNMEPWGGTGARLGNNPFIVAAPHPQGPVVLDMAMTQFSYGRLDQHRQRGEALPVAGGLDAAGRPSRDAEEVLETERLLPAGFWKGSGLSFALDLVAALLSSGKLTADIADTPGEQGVSQVFLAFDLERVGGGDAIRDKVLQAARWMRGDDGDAVRYPGERAAAVRRVRAKEGIPLPDGLWDEVRAMLG